MFEKGTVEKMGRAQCVNATDCKNGLKFAIPEEWTMRNIAMDYC